MFENEDELNEYIDLAKTIRSALHQIPECGLSEFETAKTIRQYLTNFDISYEPVINTGTLVYFDNDKESTIAFRADIDGLSIQEMNQVSYCSINQGMMHACGHDGHATNLLLFAKYLKDHMPEIDYNVLLIFQPAEEGPGGAKLIVEQNIFSKYNVKEIYGLHVSPDLDFGVLSSRPNAFMASACDIIIDVYGKSSHGARPHQGIDSIVIASEIISSLQNIVSRQINPNETGVITIGKINGGTRANILAGHVKMEGTIRTFNDDVHNLILEKINNIIEATKIKYQCDINVEYIIPYPVLVNDENLYNKFKTVFPESILADKSTGAEDFSFYSSVVPSLFYNIGIKKDNQQYPLHHELFDFDPSICIEGIKSFYKLLINS